MAKLENKRDIPPGGWVYVERETGQRFSETSWDDLFTKVKAHREYKGLPVDTLQAIIEEQICLSVGPEYCRPLPGENYKPVQDLAQKLTTDMAVAANKSLVEFVKGGFQFNDLSEAQQRAEVCRTCPFNKQASGCSCHIIYRTLELLTPTARKQPGISVCMACGCSLQVKVNMPAEVIAASLAPGTAFPPWCWQNGMRPLDGKNPA